METETKKIEIKKVELPLYQVAESISDFENNVKVNIFRCNLQELVFEKMFILFEKYNPAVEDLEFAKYQLQEETDKILLETDFKSLGLTNEKMRTAYIKQQTEAIDDRIDDYQSTVRFYKNKLSIINELIDLKKLELKIETNLQEEE